MIDKRRQMIFAPEIMRMTSDRDVDIETLGTRVVYQNRWMRVREDAIRRPDGSDGIYGLVEKPDSVMVVPLEDDGRIHLVEQYRYPVGARYWEFPQGSWEQKPETDPADVAHGELREETGLVAAKMVHAGHLFQACGYSTQGYHVYVASDLRRGETALDHEEQDLVSQAFSLPELERMIRDGEIKDATTVAAFGLLRLKGLV